MSYSPERAQEYSRRQPQLSDSVASYIRDLIMSGEVRSGEFLRVERIAQDMQVSMTPVREALAALRREGFVDQEPRRGFVVAPLTTRDISDLFDQQGDVAAELAVRAVGALSQNQMERLGELQDALEDAIGKGVVDDVDGLNFEFHRIINKASGSKKLEWILSMLVRYAPRRFFSNVPGWEASIMEHRLILSALRRGDREKVRSAVKDHVTRSGELLVKHLQDKESLDRPS